ncbi:MAG TPA: hypothetical protein VGJ57_06230 [Nitrospirales bacterium]
MFLRAFQIRASQLLALTLAVGYFGLSIFAAGCLFEATPLGTIGPVAHHHHSAGSTGKTSHSPLCAWACQAGSSSTVGNVVVAPFMVFVLWGAVMCASVVYLRLAWAQARPRSPPLRFH